jgi:hypothetical protein
VWAILTDRLSMTRGANDAQIDIGTESARTGVAK